MVASVNPRVHGLPKEELIAPPFVVVPVWHLGVYVDDRYNIKVSVTSTCSRGRAECFVRGPNVRHHVLIAPVRAPKVYDVRVSVWCLRHTPYICVHLLAGFLLIYHFM